MAYRLLDVKIAGQVFNWPTVDNSFAFALFQFGPVVAALLGILFAAALWGHAKQGRRVEVCCLFAMLAYAYMEVQPFHLTTNPTALLLCGAVLPKLPPGGRKSNRHTAAWAYFRYRKECFPTCAILFFQKSACCWLSLAG